MKCVCTNIPPEAVEAHFTACYPCARHFKNTTRHPQCRIGGNNLDASDPLGDFSSIRTADATFFTVFDVNGVDFLAGLVGQGFGGAKVGEEGAVSLEDVGLFKAGGHWLWSIWPSSSVFGGIVGAERQRARSDAKVEV